MIDTNSKLCTMLDKMSIYQNMYDDHLNPSQKVSKLTFFQSKEKSNILERTVSYLKSCLLQYLNIVIFCWGIICQNRDTTVMNNCPVSTMLLTPKPDPCLLWYIILQNLSFKLFIYSVPDKKVGWSFKQNIRILWDAPGV